MEVDADKNKFFSAPNIKGREPSQPEVDLPCQKNEDCLRLTSSAKKSPGLKFLQLQNRRKGLTDVVIECKDGSFFRVHQPILLATSPGLQKLLSEEGVFDGEGHLMITAPNFSVLEIARILFMIYCGKTVVKGQTEEAIMDELLYEFFYKESLKHSLTTLIYQLWSGQPRRKQYIANQFKDSYLRFTRCAGRTKRDCFIYWNGEVKAADLDSNSPSPRDENFDVICGWGRWGVNFRDRQQLKKPVCNLSRRCSRENTSNSFLEDRFIKFPNDLDQSSSDSGDSDNSESESDESSDSCFSLQKCTSEYLASVGYTTNYNERKRLRI